MKILEYLWPVCSSSQPLPSWRISSLYAVRVLLVATCRTLFTTHFWEDPGSISLMFFPTSAGFPQSFLLLMLSKPSLSSHITYSSPQTTLAAPQWPLSSLLPTPWTVEPNSRCSTPGAASQALGRESSFAPVAQHMSGLHQHQGTDHPTRSGSTHVFSVAKLPGADLSSASSGAWCYSSPSTRMCIWTFRGWCYPISPAWRSHWTAAHVPSEWPGPSENISGLTK